MKEEICVRILSLVAVMMCFSATLYLCYKSQTANIYTSNTQRSFYTNINITICSQQDRQNHIKKVCKKYKDFQEYPKSKFLYIPEKNIAYCYIPKNGCSTWKTVLALSTKVGRNMSREFYPHSPRELKKTRSNTRIYHQPSFQRQFT